MAKLIVWIWLALLAAIMPAEAWSADKLFANLRSTLIAKGADAQQVYQIMEHPGLKFEAKVLARMLSAKEAMLNYKQYLDKRWSPRRGAL